MLPGEHTGSDSNPDDEFVAIELTLTPGGKEEKRLELTGEDAKRARENVGGVWIDFMNVYVTFYNREEGPKVTPLTVE